MATEENQLSVFFSWQSDSSNKTNLSFIEGCLKKAVKEIAKENSTIILVDRDTKGIGGTPGIVDVILKKIRSCDVFVWDATLIQDAPRFAPNPNVLLELGYALAILGEGRIIGIMNEAHGRGPDKLPFDLVHRRWPIRYNLEESNPQFGEMKKTAKKSLTQDITKALRDALKEPKTGAILSDIDFHTGRVLWGVINSDWMRNWTYYKRNQIQYDQREYRDKMEDYCDEAAKPENQFADEKLKSLHDDLIKAMQSYLWTAAVEMVPCHGNENVFVIGVKDRARQQGWIENYDEIYDGEVDAIRKGIDAVEAAWETYVFELRSKYPEITHQSKR
jgi:hypothetical protein